MDASEITKETTAVRDPVCGMTVDPSAGKPHHEHAGHTYHFCSENCRAKFAAAPDDYVEATDPVCGMKVDRSTARHMATHGGERFYFCSGRCKDKFEATPETHLGDKSAREPMPAGTIYTCPMHPEIEQIGPGDCPICGMALEPKGVPAGDEGPNPELIDFRRRFAVGAALTLPLLVIAMGPMLGLPVGAWIGERTARWLELILATPVILWSGWPFLVRGWKSFRTMNLNMFSLIGMGVTAAYAFSVVAGDRAGAVPARLPRPFRPGRGLLRGRRRDRRAGAARADSRARRARAHWLGDPRSARSRRQDRPRHPTGRPRGRNTTRTGAGRRPAAGAARRQGSGGRGGRRGSLLGRRVRC